MVSITTPPLLFATIELSSTKRGIAFDYRKLVNPNIGVGFTLGWNIFYQEQVEATYTIDNISLTGKQYRYSNHVPILLSTTYYLKPDETVNPFFGLGIGTIYTLRNTNMNLYTLEQEAWNFALAPEVGLVYSVEEAAAITFSVKYNQAFKAGKELDASQSYVSLNLGFVFKK